MTKAELSAYLRSHLPKDPRSDADLTSTWLKENPTFKVEETPEHSSGFEPIPFAIRMGAGVLGAEGGPTGALIGAGGEAAAQAYEHFLSGNKQPFRPSEMAASGLISAIPFSGAVKEAGTLARVGGQAAKGAAIGGASSAIESVVGKGQAPDPTEMLKSAGIGAAGGAATEALLGPALRRFLPGPSGRVLPNKPTPAVPPEIKQPAKPFTPTPPQAPLDIKGMVPPPNVGAPGVREVNPIQPIPPGRPRTSDELQTLTSVKHLPEDQREDFAKLLDVSSPQRRGVQSNPRTAALASYQVVPLERLKPGTTMKAEDLTAHREAWSALGTQVFELADKVASGNATEAEKLLFLRRQQEHQIVGLNYIGAVSEVGRGLQSLKMQTRGIQVADSEFLAELMKSSKFKTPEELAKAIAASKNDPAKQFDLLLKSRKGTLTDYGQAYLYTNLLSGIKTPIRKTIADVLNLMANTASLPFAVAADVTKHALKGTEREVFMGELAPQLFGMAHAIPDAIKELSYVLGHGYSMKNVEQFAQEGTDALGHMPHELPGGYLTNFPIRNLKAVTAFFQELGRSQEMYGGAYASARKAGLTHPGQIVDHMVKALTTENPLNEKLAKAGDEFAKRATFMDPSGPILQAILNLKNNESIPALARLGMTFVVPIIRLPGKVLQRGLETSPAGFLMNAAKQEGRAGSQGLGKALMGTAALMAFVPYAMQGKLSGSGPTNPAERAALMEKGWLPNAMKIGDKWYEYHLAQPFSTEMSIVANGWEAFNQSKKTDQDAEDTWGKMGEAFARSANAVLDQSYFAGLSAFQKALSDPNRAAGAFTRGLAQDVVPFAGLQRNITQAMDPTVRSPKTMTEAMQSIIPGQSENVPAKLTRFGEPVQRQGSALQRGVNPMGIAREKKYGEDPVADLLEQVGITPIVPRASIKVKGETLELTPEQKHTIEEAIGRERRALLEPLAKRDTTPKEKVVQAVLTRATAEVNDRAKRKLKHHQPLTVEDLAPHFKRKHTKEEIDRLYQAYQEGTDNGQANN